MHRTNRRSTDGKRESASCQLERSAIMDVRVLRQVPRRASAMSSNKHRRRRVSAALGTSTRRYPHPPTSRIRSSRGPGACAMDKPPVSGEEARLRSIEDRPCRWDRISDGDIPSEHGSEIVARSRLFLCKCLPVEMSSDRRGASPKTFRRIITSEPKDAFVPSTIVDRRRRKPSSTLR